MNTKRVGSPEQIDRFLVQWRQTQFLEAPHHACIDHLRAAIARSRDDFDEQAIYLFQNYERLMIEAITSARVQRIFEDWKWDAEATEL